MATKNIFFIDSRVADYQMLTAGLPVDSEWVLLNAKEDGVLQMQNALTGYGNLDSIQVVSHGKPCQLWRLAVRPFI